jgi:hypothetical protein
VQKLEYLGFELNLVYMTVALTPKNKAKLQQVAQELLTWEGITIQELSSFMGTLVTTDLGVRNAPLHYKGLEIV